MIAKANFHELVYHKGGKDFTFRPNQYIYDGEVKITKIVEKFPSDYSYHIAEIYVASKHTEDEIVLWRVIRDNGRGISTYNLNKIFGKDGND